MRNLRHCGIILALSGVMLELQGQQAGEYVECSGLGSHNEVDEQTTVTTSGAVVVGESPGALQWHRITLKASTPNRKEVADSLTRTGTLSGGKGRMIRLSPS